MRSIYLFIVFSFLISVHVQSQYVSYGTDPARLKWKTFSTPHYKLIFPESNDSIARRYALFLEHSHPYIGTTIGKSDVRSFPVIFHPGNMQSNGMVVWAPRRMEFYTTPSSTLFAQSWDRHLVLHESRHIQQMLKFSRGVFKPLNYILGEQTVGIATFVTPKWFFEGDAVVAETAMSNSGRGRLPEFNMTYRAQMLSGKFFSYDKWALGSYKDYTGSYYALGYNMVSYARYKYGEDIWDKVTSRYTQRFFNIPPFSKALKHHAGVNTKTLFNETFNFLNEEWIRQDGVYENSKFGEVIDYVTPQTTRYISYKYPQVLDDSSVIAVKTSLRDISSLVRIKNGEEALLSYLGNLNSRIILNGNRIYWTEYVPGMRWTHENYSDLKYFDLTTGKITKVTSKQRFLAPSVNRSGEMAAVSQPGFSGVNKVVLIDIETRKELKSYNVPANGFVKETAFLNDNEIVAVVNSDERLYIFRLDIQSGQWDELMEPTSANITSLTVHDGKLFFESGLDGTNNVYVFDTSASQSYRLTTSRFGAFSPVMSRDGKRLFFADHSASGARIASVSVDDLQRESADFNNVYDHALAEAITEQEQFRLDPDVLLLSADSLETMNFTTKPYRKVAHLFHVHSWMPFYFDAADAANSISDDLSTIVKPGSMLLSQNALSTMMSQVGWYYDNGHHYGKLALSYTGLYPVMDISVEYGGKAFDYNWKKDEGDNDILSFSMTNRNLIDAEARVYVPVNLSRNHYISGIRPSVTYSYTNNQYQQYGSNKLSEFQYMLSELLYYRYRKLAYQDLLPRFGYQVRLQYLNVPFDTKNFGALYAAGLTTYWPGLVRGHGLMLRTMYQYQDLEGKAIYIPKRLISQARGYNYAYQTRQRLELKADYSFSIFCPDLSINGLAYIKRLRSNIFYDISQNQMNKKSGWTTQSSYGIDLIFDCNLLRLSYPISMGMRFVNPIDNGGLQAEGLFSVSF